MDNIEPESSLVKQLHDKAMKYATQAYIALLHDKDSLIGTEDARTAYQFEEQAAKLVSPNPESEPTRSILYRSAATLAFWAREYDKSVELIKEGYTTHTPRRMAIEFDDLYKNIIEAKKQKEE
jgi:hypothetical protein